MASIKSDRYTTGFMVGVIAGLIADAVSFILSNLLKMGKVSYEDFAAVLIYGSRASTVPEIIFAHLVQLFFSALVGALFVFWIRKVTDRFLIFKGICYGLFVWFFAFSVAQLYKLQFLSRLDLITVIQNYVAAITYGVVLGLTLRTLDKKPKQK